MGHISSSDSESKMQGQTAPETDFSHSQDSDVESHLGTEKSAGESCLEEKKCESPTSSSSAQQGDAAALKISLVNFAPDPGTGELRGKPKPNSELPSTPLVSSTSALPQMEPLPSPLPLTLSLPPTRVLFLPNWSCCEQLYS